MNYIEQNLQSGEEIKYVANLHFFLFVQPLVFLLLGWWLYGSETAVLHYGGMFLLFIGLVSAIQNKNSELRKYYERKIAEGKNNMPVLNAIRAKLIARMFAVIKSNLHYDFNHINQYQNKNAVRNFANQKSIRIFAN